MDKNSLRKDILDKRKGLSKDELELKSEKIKKLLLSSKFYQNPQSIMVYIDFRNEVKTEGIIKESLKVDKDIILPISIVETRELLLSKLMDYDKELSPGSYGILEPKQEFIREVKHDVIDLVLVPGVAFDRRGYRIGYGGGYYDRFLSKLDKSVPKVALAFNVQMVDYAYEDDHDIPVDYIITENEIIEC
ncbi:5-formyltetrahydrofolate cyclo-ligase [Sporosalibacterium faouarense]|uniref:5-formyltetrahydrofolate cyclo-ligase n=1 Tax=Sporosalibacterium faouarense TaxID=516123 RepID=UPI00192B72D7|nr:5-formyltetrahydrofolate cyclo-ligase [Sporosalibacterium faouarense]